LYNTQKNTSVERDGPKRKGINDLPPRLSSEGSCVGTFAECGMAEFAKREPAQGSIHPRTRDRLWSSCRPTRAWFPGK